MQIQSLMREGKPGFVKSFLSAKQKLVPRNIAGPFRDHLNLLRDRNELEESAGQGLGNFDVDPQSRKLI
jgi:hypothetical protein